MGEAKISVRRIEVQTRMDVLQRHFGNQLTLCTEQAVYQATRELVPAYHGAYWHIYELSNGGLYMAPEQESVQICSSENGVDEAVSADGAGIAACLYAFSRLAFTHTHDVFTEHYHWLREFALEHAEASTILRVID